MSAPMRGVDQGQTQRFSYLAIDERIPADHPLRALQALVHPLLAALSPRFDALYAAEGRPSIPPERLLRALLVQVLYTIRSERQLMEQLNDNLLFRWFVRLNADERVWDPTVFTKNRDRLLAGDIADALLREVLQAADTRGLLSHEHVTVDGTLLEAWASHKSFRPKDDPTPPPSDGDPKNPTVNFRREKRSNATHQSVTDPDCRLARKSHGTAALLSHLGSVLMDNRHGLIVPTDVRAPSGTAERKAAAEMLTTLEPRARRRTSRPTSMTAGPRAPSMGAPPRTTRHAGFAVSQQKRKRVEERFGWGKTIGGLRKLHHRGREKVAWIFAFTNAAYNLVRIRTLIRAGVCA